MRGLCPDLKKYKGCELDSSGPGELAITGFCEHSTVPSSPIKCVAFHVLPNFSTETLLHGFST
jgi:hypothetical protein